MALKKEIRLPDVGRKIRERGGQPISRYYFKRDLTNAERES
jgi:hypothetical protein